MKRDNSAEYHLLLTSVPDPLKPVDARLINWAEWSKDRPRRGRCLSLEGGYRSPQHWEPEQPRIVYDTLDALDVFKAVMGTPERTRWILALWYIHKAPEGYIRRKLGIHRTRMVDALNDSRRMVDNRLRVV